MNLPLIQPESWTADALCAQIGGDMWFPDLGESPAAAKSICRRCPVQAECLELAEANDERYGVWGGLSVRERLKRRRAAA